MVVVTILKNVWAWRLLQTSPGFEFVGERFGEILKHNAMHFRFLVIEFFVTDETIHQSMYDGPILNHFSPCG